MAEDNTFWVINAQGTDDFVVSGDTAEAILQAINTRANWIHFIDHSGANCGVRPASVNAVYESNFSSRERIREHNHMVKKEEQKFKTNYGWELTDDD